MNSYLLNGQRAQDPYRLLGDDQALPASGSVLLTLERWLAESSNALPPGLQFGVCLPNTEDIDERMPGLGRCQLIVLEFPAFADGRAYSQARVLRERHGFEGELRAVGEAVVSDQLGEMARCGFNAFVLRGDQDVAAAEQRLQSINAALSYQRPATAHGRTVLDLRRG